MPKKHSRLIDDGRAVRHTERLRGLTQELRVRRATLSEITELDMNCWFHDDDPPTCRAVANHALKIPRADLSYPIILSADGRLMDGGHRVCNALMMGLPEIEAVQFREDPAPDHVLPAAEK